MGEDDTSPEQSRDLTLVESTHEYDEVVELRRAINSTRLRIADSLDDLHHEVEEQLDWRGWIDANPWKAVGIAFAAGFYVGMR